MKRTALLENISPWAKLLLLSAFLVLSALLTSLLGLLIGKFYFETDLASLADYLANPTTDRQVYFLKFYQLINQIGVFFIPVIIFALFVSRSVSRYFSLDQPPNTTNLLIMGVVVFTMLPFVNFLGELNQGMQMPDSLKWVEEWMREMEDQAALITDAFLRTSSIGGLMVNLLIVALVPAIGEELLFRGALLKLFAQITRNIHLSVLITSLLFAAIHIQFYGFLPRFFIGMMLGYAYVITGSLWVPMAMHFINNGASVMIYYLHFNGYIKVSMEKFGAADNTVYIIGSALITLWLLLIVSRRERRWFAGLKE